MKNTILLFSLIFLLSSCHNKAQEQNKQKEERQLSKLEQLKLLPTDTVLDFYDLSNDSISEFPNLSSYTIKSLYLSHNQIDSITLKYLPIGLEKLDLSFNSLKKIDIRSYSSTLSSTLILKDINLSNNNIESFYLSNNSTKRIDLSYNKLIKVELYSNNDFDYLDISNNPELSNIVDFFPNRIDTIIRDNIKNNRPLQKREIIFKPTILYIIRDSVKSNK